MYFYCHPGGVTSVEVDFSKKFVISAGLQDMSLIKWQIEVDLDNIKKNKNNNSKYFDCHQET